MDTWKASKGHEFSMIIREQSVIYLEVVNTPYTTGFLGSLEFIRNTSSVLKQNWRKLHF